MLPPHPASPGAPRGGQSSTPTPLPNSLSGWQGRIAQAHQARAILHGVCIMGVASPTVRF